MKKAIFLLVLLCSVVLSACTNSPNANVAEESVPVSYGTPIELAKAEFETMFAEYEGLKITETATLSRTDEATNIVVQITYTSDHGDGVYGFEYIQDEYGNWDILQQGENVTIDNLVKVE